MKPLESHAELFDFRNAVTEALSDNGFVWLSDFGSVDLQECRRPPDVPETVPVGLGGQTYWGSATRYMLDAMGTSSL